MEMTLRSAWNKEKSDNIKSVGQVLMVLGLL
jgi:hypothetical protein